MIRLPQPPRIPLPLSLTLALTTATIAIIPSLRLRKLLLQPIAPADLAVLGFGADTVVAVAGAAAVAAGVVDAGAESVGAGLAAAGPGDVFEVAHCSVCWAGGVLVGS